MCKPERVSIQFSCQNVDFIENASKDSYNNFPVKELYLAYK
jgi:hypothetical protein